MCVSDIIIIITVVMIVVNRSEKNWQSGRCVCVCLY